MKKALLYIFCSALLVACSDMIIGYESADDYLATVDEENKIYYQSSDGKEIKTNKLVGNIKMISNTYEDGRGVITFNHPIRNIYIDMFRNSIKLTKVMLPLYVTKIDDNAFNNCYFLTEIVWPQNVQEIGNGTFWGCVSLAEITLPDNLEIIGEGAFKSCVSLSEITLPSKIATIKPSAFQDCTYLSAIYCKANTPPAGGNKMFGNNHSERRIYVPRASVELYKEAPFWRDYAEYIVGYDF